MSGIAIKIRLIQAVTATALPRYLKVRKSTTVANRIIWLRRRMGKKISGEKIKIKVNPISAKIIL